MGFFKNIGKSIYGPNYYTELLQKPFSYSIKYFLLFILLIAVIFSIKVTVTTYPSINKAAHSADIIKDKFPADLEVKMTNGTLSTNATEPYFISSASLGINEEKDAKPTNVLVIDTSSNGSPEDFAKYDTSILLTKNFAVSKNNQKIEVQSYENAPNMTVNRAVFSGFVDKWLPLINLLLPIMFVFIFIVFFIGLNIIYIFYLLFGALLIWLVASIKKAKMGYGKAYQLGFHLLTLPIIIFNLFGITLFRFSCSLILIILAIINIKKSEEVSALAANPISASPVPASPAPAPPVPTPQNPVPSVAVPPVEKSTIDNNSQPPTQPV